MNRRSIALLIALIGIFGYRAVSAEDRWVWSDRNRHDRAAFHVNRDERAIANDKYDSERYVRNGRDREPTTRRPIPGAPPSSNDDIDDYEDDNDGDKNRIGSRNYPYAPNGFYGGNQLAGNGYNGYPGVGANSAGNGILVGPGGPTGFIGRPQSYFPGTGSAGTLGQPGFGTSPGGINLGYPIQGGAIPGNGVYSNGFGQTQGYPITQGTGNQYPGNVYNPNGQYPGNPLVGGGGVQYPGIGQYPVTAGQYPVSSGILYTEGYGLANLNGYNPNSPAGFPQNLFGGFNGFRSGNDDYDQLKRKLQAEDQNSSLESRNFSDRNVDDKINKNLKKSA